MRVAFVTTNITNGAGTERVVVNVCNFLVANGYDVAIHSVTSTKGHAFYSLNSRVEIFHHGLSGYATEVSAWKKLLKKLNNLLLFNAVLRKIKADVVIGTGKSYNIYFVLFKVFNRKKKFIGCEHFAYNAPMSSATVWAKRLFYPSLDALVVLTEKDKAHYDKFIRQVVCIPNFLSFYPEKAAPLEAKQVLAIGRHTEQKGFDWLLDIWKKIAADIPDWKLVIIGDGPLLADRVHQVKALGIGDRVLLKPPTKQIIDEYYNSSLYLMTSRYEAFPMVLLESMACGIPCVAYNCDTGPAEIIRSGEDGVIVAMSDAEAYKEAVERLLMNDALRKKIGAQARNNVKRYDVEKIGPLWLQLLNKL